MKKCSKCLEEKQDSCFSRRNDRPKTPLHSWCKDCVNLRQRNKNAEDGGWLMKSRYGMTLSDKKEMIKKQGNGCAICGDNDPKHIDHDHKTNKIRGVLCNYCNLTLGLAKEDIHRLQKCIAYLRFHKGITSAEVYYGAR